MSTLSILTPVLASTGTIKLLPETIESVSSQLLPNNWRIEWIVVEDGAQPILNKYKWPKIVKYRAINKQVGEPSARTLALCMANGEYVLAFDADDTLPKNALFKIISAIENYNHPAWIAGQEATPNHVSPWINRNNPEDKIPIGLCSINIIYPFWLRTGQFPITFQCTYKKSVLWEFGGYPAMPYAGDINLMFAVSSVYPGVVLKDTLLNYRRWPGQMTAQKEYFDIKDLSFRHAENWIQTITRKFKT